LALAASNGKGDVVEILLRNGANINEKNVKTTSFGELDDCRREKSGICEYLVT
jgi:hypothetical protein